MEHCIKQQWFGSLQRLSGLGVWFLLWVQEVPGSNPGWALLPFLVNFPVLAQRWTSTLALSPCSQKIPIRQLRWARQTDGTLDSVNLYLPLGDSSLDSGHYSTTSIESELAEFNIQKFERRMTQMLTKLELPIQGWMFIQDLSPVLTTRGYYGNDQLRNITFRSNPLTR